MVREAPGSLVGGDYLFYVSAPLECFSSVDLHELVTELLDDVGRRDGGVASA